VFAPQSVVAVAVRKERVLRGADRLNDRVECLVGPSSDFRLVTVSRSQGVARAGRGSVETGLAHLARAPPAQQLNDSAPSPSPVGLRHYTYSVRAAPVTQGSMI
jgi:hypothetical protein